MYTNHDLAIPVGVFIRVLSKIEKGQALCWFWNEGNLSSGIASFVCVITFVYIMTRCAQYAKYAAIVVYRHRTSSITP